jgi:hypothetical protein
MHSAGAAAETRDLRPGRRRAEAGGVVENAGELAGVDHAGLVDDQDGPAGEGLVAAAPEYSQLWRGAEVDAGLALQGVGCLPGEGGAEHVLAGLADRELQLLSPRFLATIPGHSILRGLD